MGYCFRGNVVNIGGEVVPCLADCDAGEYVTHVERGVRGWQNEPGRE